MTESRGKLKEIKKEMKSQIKRKSRDKEGRAGWESSAASAVQKRKVLSLSKRIYILLYISEQTLFKRGLIEMK